MARQYDARPADTVRNYAKIVGAVIVLIGIVGLIRGEGHLLGLFNIDIPEDVIHLLTGGLMLFVGFQPNSGTARTVVGGIGVAYLLVGLLGFIAPNLFGLLEHGYTLADNLLHLALGVAGIAVGFGLRR